MVALSLSISAFLAIIFGIIILIWPKFLNLFVGLYLVISGTLSLLGGYGYL